MVIVMAKTPRPGRVKTRLAQEIGSVAAAGWQRRQSEALLRRLGRDPRFDLWLAIAPDRDAVNARLWPQGVRRLPQGRGELGRRMARALQAAAPRPAVLIGSDIPGIRARHLCDALNRLRRADVVFGPATDGGYWLIGARGAALSKAGRRLRGVRWSTPHALADSVARFVDCAVDYAATLADIDSAADLTGTRRPGATTGMGEPR